MKEKCPVCKAECENGATACSVCGFAYKPKIDMAWPIPEDAKNWLETAVKPYRAQWEAKKQKTKFKELETFFTDPRDGKVYKTVKIGSQVWMAENLDYNAPGSKYYNNDPIYGEKYGRLYDWITAMKTCLPSGWHLPNDDEWNVLSGFVGGNTGGKHLKAQRGWKDYNGRSGNGTDDFGFTALPGGCGSSGGRFYNVSYRSYWWSSTEYKYSNDKAYCRGVNHDGDSVDRNYNDKGDLFSVRCLQNYD